MAALFPPARLLASFSWKGVAAFVLFTAALSAWWWSGVLLTPKTLTFQEHAEYFLMLWQQSLLGYFPMFVLVTFTDSLPLEGRARRVALAAAVLAGALLAVQARCLVSPDQIYYVYGSIKMPFCSAFPTWRTYIDIPGAFVAPLVMGGAITAFVLARRREIDLAEALRARRAARIEAWRTRIESDIDAMRSRVDPDTLLATLRAVSELYDRNLAEGEARLEQLIQELRLAARRTEEPGTPA